MVELDDYSLFYRGTVSLSQLATVKYTTLVSGFNLSERVVQVFRAVDAKRKIWVVHPEYGLGSGDLPDGEGSDLFLGQEDQDEAEFCKHLMNYAEIDGSTDQRICLDITGLMRPHLMYLLLLLHRAGVRSFDCIYSEPLSYAQRERTEFSTGGIRETRQVRGFEGAATPDSASDLLVIGAGYDDQLISEVAQYKDSATKVLVLGFPSLRADMYQQNVLRVARSSEAIGDVPRRWRYFAPAFDPFGTAGVVARIADEQIAFVGDGSLYLSPLSTKAQALGFALFFVFEGMEHNASVIFPFSNGYAPETGLGLGRTWRYVVEFPDWIAC